jgi:uncharacterized RDD family membrane protein YckC
MLDTVQHVETPEGVDLALRAAGPMPRFFAWVIDIAVRAVLVFVLAIPLSAVGYGGNGVLLILIFGLEWFYPVVLEVLDAGRTPGKRALGLRVVRYDGTPLEWTSSVIRNLLRAADMVPLPHVAGLLSMVMTRGFRRLGDLAAGTIVIHDHPPESTGAGAAIQPFPPPFRLTVDEQRAVVGYAARTPKLSRARAIELANLAAPPLEPGADPVLRLQGIAAWLTGRRPGETRT